MNPLTARRLRRPLVQAKLEHDRWLRRLTCQMEFAAGLLGSDHQAVVEANRLVDVNSPSPSGRGGRGVRELVKEVEALLAPFAQEAKSFTIHCVGHGHIDMNWMWSWPETVATTHDTFASVLSLMRAYPELTYSQSQASVYALIEKYHPMMFEEIQERVKEGRWEVTAAQWVEGDKNLVNGESLIRHYLYSRQYFQEKFGLSPEDVPVQWEPDTFGHANTIPMIASHGAVKFYYACRTGGGFGHERVGDERPPLFWWQAPDGSRILVNREISWYNSYVNIGDNIALPALEFFRANGLRDWMNVYGIGNHGGGPTRKEIDYYLEMREWPIYPKIEFSTAKRFFETVEARTSPPPSPLPTTPGIRGEGEITLPVLDHELNFEFTGCYTSQSLIKQANRLGENACLEAEALVSFGSRVEGQGPASDSSPVPRPSTLLRDAWLNVLFNQFHDILPGSGVRQTREHACALFQETAAITSSLKREAMKTIAAGIDTLALLPDTPEGREERERWTDPQPSTLAPQPSFEAGPGLGAMLTGHSRAGGGGERFKPIVIFNPLAWEREDVVEVSLWDTDFDPALIVALDEEGVAHPTFFLEEQKEDWGHERKTLLFYARVPALGYRTYLLGEGSPQGHDTSPAPPGVQVIDGETVQSPFLKVRFGRFDGGLASVEKLGHGFEHEDLGWLQYVVEQPRGMTAWALGGEGTSAAARPVGATRFDLAGEVRNVATLEASGRNLFVTGTHQYTISERGSKAASRTLIHSRKPRIDVAVSLDWREIGTPDAGIPGLVIGFFYTFGFRSATYETPFGSVERTQSGEVPAGRFAIPTGELLSLLNDGKAGGTDAGSAYRLRIIRSSFDPDPTPEVNQQTFRYGLYFHDTPPTRAELMRLGMEFNHPLIVHATTFHHGEGRSFSEPWVTCDSPSVVISSVRPAQDGNGWIVQLVEADGTADQATLTGQFSSAECVDAMERPLEGQASPSQSGWVIPIRSFGIASVRLRR